MKTVRRLPHGHHLLGLGGWRLAEEWVRLWGKRSQEYVEAATADAAG